MDPRCREVALVVPNEARRVRVERGGVTMVFGVTAFVAAAKARRDDALIALVQARGGDEVRLQPEDMPDALLHNAVLFAAAKLLEEGKARVEAVPGGAPAARVLVSTWEWIGCSGGCRQAGREFRLDARGKAFLRVIDIFEDGEPGTF